MARLSTTNGSARRAAARFWPWPTASWLAGARASRAACPLPCRATRTLESEKGRSARKTARTSTRSHGSSGCGGGEDRGGLWPAPVALYGPAPRPRRRAGPGGEDPLLLLRPTVRHRAAREGRTGDRFRALAGIPLQPGQAVPQGREALPARRAP